MILDWGFWHRRDRNKITAEIARKGLRPLWYYIDTPEAQNRAFIERRNADPGAGTFYVDAGLAAKCQAQFDPRGRGRWISPCGAWSKELIK